MEHRMAMEMGAQARVRVRYWAGAAHAAGRDTEDLDVALAAQKLGPVTGADIRASILAAHPDMEAVLARCSLLHDGRRLADDVEVTTSADVEVLPPFVGG